MCSVVGPLAGGFLSKPEENFPGLVKLMPWLRNVRYWIPCFVGSVLCMFTAIFTWVTAPETLPREVAKKAREDKKRNAARVEQIKEQKAANQTLTTEEEMMLVLSRDSYFDLLFEKRVLTTCVLYGMYFHYGLVNPLYSFYLLYLFAYLLPS